MSYPKNLFIMIIQRKYPYVLFQKKSSKKSMNKTAYVIGILKSCIIDIFNLFFRNSISRSIQQAI